MGTSNSLRFNELCKQADACRRCQEMAHRSAVIGPANGNLGVRLMLIAEAPGRFGADRTRVPLSGDRTGDNFQHLLDQAELIREQCFISNAVLCNPRDGKNRNRRPYAGEIRNCSSFLKHQIELVNPEFVVSLGAVALSALNLVEGHNLKLSTDVGRIARWFGRNLIPLYHPSPRTLGLRSFSQQKEDFQFIAETMKQTGRI